MRERRGDHCDVVLGAGDRVIAVAAEAMISPSLLLRYSWWFLTGQRSGSLASHVSCPCWLSPRLLPA
jgi:hypothetical protein